MNKGDPKTQSDTLQAFEDLLQRALDSGEVGVWDWEIATGKITWSETLERIFGVPEGTFPGTYDVYRSFIHPDDISAMEASTARALEQGIEHVAEHRIIRPDGSVRWIHCRGRAHYNEAGAPVRMTGTSVDVTERKKIEDSFKLKALVLDNISEAVNLSNEQGTILYTNAAQGAMYGYRPGELIGKHIHILNDYPPEENRRIVAHVVEELRKNGTWAGELRNRRKDGSAFFTRCRISSLEMDGKLYWVGVQKDITAEKRLAELSASRAFLDSLVDNLPNMVFVKDAKDLRFVRLNKAGEELLGLSRDEILGKNDYDFFPREQADFFTSKDRAVLSGRQIVDIPEESIQTKHKGIRTLHTKKIPLFGPDGIQYLLGISEDITEHKIAEQHRLRLYREQVARAEADRSAERARFLAEASRCLSSSLEYSETLRQLAQLIVPTAADWCTITMEEDGVLKRVAARHGDPALTETVDELLQRHGPDTTQVTHSIATGATCYTPIIAPEMLEQAAQNPRHLQLMRTLGAKSCIIVPIKVRDKAIGAISLVYGHSGRIYFSEDLAMAEELGRRAGMAFENAKLYEQARRAIQVRNEFVSIASHELKTPLTSLGLQLQMARRRLDSAKDPSQALPHLVKTIEVSQRQVNRLTALIDDLLDISRIESGKLTYSFAEVDFTEVVKEVVERHQEQFLAAHCAVELDLPGPTPVVCDRFRMEQVVVNLLSNAIKYGAGKPVRVAVRQGAQGARLEVQDRGMGVPKDQQARIFNRFERAISAHNISGLGLGLYIAKEIVSGHHGAIRVESEGAGGSSFVVEIPATPH